MLSRGTVCRYPPTRRCILVVAGSSMIRGKFSMRVKAFWTFLIAAINCLCLMYIFIV